MEQANADLRGGWFRRLYWPSNPAGLGVAIGIALGLILLNQVLQFVFATAAVNLLFDGGADSLRNFVKASLVVIFPVSLVTAVAALALAGVRGGKARDVLCLRRPQLGPLGWLMVTFGFIAIMYAAMMVIVLVLGIDLAQYTPGPEGQSPETGSAGLVKEAVFDIANEPWLFALVFPSLALGAPIAEELIFRGQLFAALSNTRLGVSGTTVATSGLWALMHLSEPWLSVGLIFIMGLVFGWMLYRFGSIWVPMVCHGAWNSIYALAIFGQAGQ
ncbi:MAG: CPBP family intramembrane metalloprotease [Alphaproteobacteria bacterium]|nr:CPBP family intramembrane metalloprotease [Alphaproteobacteria bacterium]